MYLTRHKSESFDKFKEFRAEIEKAREGPIKCLRSDSGGEYLSNDILVYL